jgi:hypothetical protein
MTSFVLKVIAMFTMVIDHLGDAWLKHTTGMNIIGRIAFPIFAFQISEGYTHTKNLKKYFFRLILFAFLSQIPFMLFRSLYTTGFSLNIFFTLTIGLLAIFCYDKLSTTTLQFVKNEKINWTIKHLLGILTAILFGFIAEYACFDYGFFGTAIIFLFYVFRSHKFWMCSTFILACIIRYGLNIYFYGYHYLYVLLGLFTALSIVFICLYNGKQGKKIKYFLYAFYPVHLLLLYFLFGIVPTLCHY